MFRQFRNPTSVLLVFILCVALVSIPSEGAASNGSTTKTAANNGATTKAPATNGATTKAPANNGATAKAPANNGATAKAPANNGATTKAPATNGATTKAPANNGATAKAPANNGATAKAPANNGATAKTPANNGATTKAPANNGATTKASVKNAVTLKAPEKAGGTSSFDLKSTKAPANNGATAKAPANNGATAKAPANNGATTKAPANNGATTKASVKNAVTLKAPEKAGGTSSFDLKSMLAQLLPSSGGDVTKQAAQALEYLKYMFIGSPQEHSPSSKCLDHVTDFLQGVLSGEMWALRMVDSVGKPGSGILGGNLRWLGSFDECVDVRAAINQTGKITYPWKGQYCTAHFELQNLGKQLGVDYSKMVFGAPSLSIGVCMPNSCTDKDITLLIYKLLDTLQANATLYKPYGYCQKESLEYDTKAIVALAICSVFVVLMVLATLYDVIIQHWIMKQNQEPPSYSNGPSSVYIMTSNVDAMKSNGHAMVMPNGEKMPNDEKMPNGEKMSNGATFEEKTATVEKTEQSSAQTTYDPGTIGKALLAFSVYTNGAKILNTHQPKGTLTAINGIRFISMTWVILGHTWGFQLTSTSNVADYSVKALKRFDFQAILNATVSVDTFFTLSGLLVSYLSLKELKKVRGANNFRWGMFYFHRFWRLTPPYMLFMMFYVCLSRYLYNGPNWEQRGFDHDKCGDYWWRNLLYINNLFPTEHMCMAWGWYLANDMQFYVLSPLMIIPLYYSSVLGTLSCLGLLAIHCVSRGLIAHRDHFPPNQVFARQQNNFFDALYDKPWTRIGTYVIGVYAGYILYRTSCKIRIPKIVNIFGWLVATGIAMSVLYGLYDESGKPPQLSDTLSNLYSSLARVGWAVAISWVIVACATGHGGFINTFLSWKAMIPLSRLTYCAYLVHPVVMYFYLTATRMVLYFSDLQGIYLFCGHLCLSYGVAFLVSLAFESPMMGLEKALLGRAKNS